MAQHSMRITQTVCKFGGWNAKQVRKSSGSEEYSKRLNTALQLHMTRKASLCACQRGSIYQLKRFIRPAQPDWSSEIKGKNLLQLCCRWLHNYRTVDSNVALNKRSDIRTKFRPGATHFQDEHNH